MLREAGVAPKTSKTKVTVRLGTIVVFLGLSVSPCGAVEGWAGQDGAPGQERVGAGLVALIGAVLLAAATVLRRRFEPGRRASEHDSGRGYKETRHVQANSETGQPVS